MDNKNQNLDETVQSLKRQKEQTDKFLLLSETVIGLLSSVICVSFVLGAAFLPLADWAGAFLIAIGFILFVIGISYALKLEQIAGYYECAKCHHKYVPSYKSVLLSMHISRTRYMQCPRCKEKSWSKKVIS